jgi:hypothetical protein
MDTSEGDPDTEDVYWLSSYLHMKNVTVQYGDVLRVGDQIGEVDNKADGVTAISSGDHLHFSAWCQTESSVANGGLGEQYTALPMTPCTFGTPQVGDRAAGTMPDTNAPDINHAATIYDYIQKPIDFTAVSGSQVYVAYMASKAHDGYEYDSSDFNVNDPLGSYDQAATAGAPVKAVADGQVLYGPDQNGHVIIAHIANRTSGFVASFSPPSNSPSISASPSASGTSGSISLSPSLSDPSGSPSLSPSPSGASPSPSQSQFSPSARSISPSPSLLSPSVSQLSPSVSLSPSIEPASTTDVPWTGDSLDSTLYLQSGEYTSTVKTSLNVEAQDGNSRGISYDGVNTPWSGVAGNVLILQSGQFASTVKASLKGISGGPEGISWDGTNTPRIHFDDKLALQSGQFAATIKTSLNITGINLVPLGISWDGTNTPWSGDFPVKMYLQSGQFASTIKTSLSPGVQTTDISWNGINTLISDNTNNKLKTLSGQFTSTVKASQSVSSVELIPQGIETNNFLARLGLSPSPSPSPPA